MLSLLLTLPHSCKYPHHFVTFHNTKWLQNLLIYFWTTSIAWLQL
jgi:hypothetical protein